MRKVHLYWLDTTKPFHNGDCPEGPEKHIFTTNAGNLRPAIHKGKHEPFAFGNCKSSALCTSVQVFDEHHPEMLELSVKRFSVLSTERDERQRGCQEAHLPTNHCKTESAC